MSKSNEAGPFKTNGRVKSCATDSITLGLALEFLNGATNILTKLRCFKESKSPSNISCIDFVIKTIHSSFSIGGFCASSSSSHSGRNVGVVLFVPSISSCLELYVSKD